MGNGIEMKLVRIPADESGNGRSFWIGQYEVTNEQFRLFDTAHDSRYYVKRRKRPDGKGMNLNDAKQPAVRVSWDDAVRFCKWMSQQTGFKVSLPDEKQWELACRAGTETTLNYGSLDDDFSPYANLADKTFSTGVMNARGRMMPEGGVTQTTGGVPHLLLEGAKLTESRFDDGKHVTADAGSYKPNRWGLYDMHGNAAEWTLSEYGKDRKAVRGGSFFDRPARSTSSFRLGYRSWQRVFNVGFRVVINETEGDMN